ncbi:hypothetical protein FB451DRAFT_1393117 [Mycena latifolia]|nr:hypothetical protein FB451DRAFT_1393117 [Mycena latifolia]
MDAVKHPDVKEKHRGQYYKTKLGGAPAPRTERLQRANEKKAVTAHGAGLMSWLKKSAQDEPAANRGQTLQTAASADDHDAPIASSSSCCPVTIEEVDDEGSIHRPESPTPSEHSRLEEDGVVDWEEIFASVSATVMWQSDLPSAPSTSAASGPLPTPQPPDHACPSVRFGAPAFTRADETFQPLELPPPRRSPPPPHAIDEAIKKIHTILRPLHGPNTKGYKHADLNMVLRGRLELMLSFLRLYAGDGYTEWAKKADIIAKSTGSGDWISRRIREWSIAFVKDEANLPTAEYRKFNGSILEDEDLAQEIQLHLQGLGTFISAQDVVNFVSSEEMKTQLNLKHGISLRTAQNWMKQMKYRWTKEPTGMYSDGHKREDVVDYRQNVFLPWWAAYAERTRRWTKKGGDESEATETVCEGDLPPKKSQRRAEEEMFEEWEEEPWRELIGMPDGKIVVIWRHDKCIFYANDCRKIRWVHFSESVKPRAKGEGVSMMVIAFVSPDHGWEARLTMRPGKNHDGYYGNKEILEHATIMMDTLDAKYPDETHVFAYDNATNHTA